MRLGTCANKSYLKYGVATQIILVGSYPTDLQYILGELNYPKIQNVGGYSVIIL